jgi:integrase
VAMASLPRGVDGRRRRLRRTFDTRSDAELFLSGLTPEEAVPAEDLTVGDLLGHSSVATTRRHYVRAVRPTVPHAGGLDAVLG